MNLQTLKSSQVDLTSSQPHFLNSKKDSKELEGADFLAMILMQPIRPFQASTLSSEKFESQSPGIELGESLSLDNEAALEIINSNEAQNDQSPPKLSVKQLIRLPLEERAFDQIDQRVLGFSQSYEKDPKFLEINQKSEKNKVSPLAQIDLMKEPDLDIFRSLEINQEANSPASEVNQNSLTGHQGKDSVFHEMNRDEYPFLTGSNDPTKFDRSFVSEWSESNLGPSDLRNPVFLSSLDLEEEVDQSTEGKNFTSQSSNVDVKFGRIFHLPPKEILFGSEEQAPVIEDLKEMSDLDPEEMDETQARDISILKKSHSEISENDFRSDLVPSSKLSGEASLIRESSVLSISKKKFPFENEVIPFTPQTQIETRDVKFGVTEGGGGKERLTSESVLNLSEAISTLSIRGGGEMRIRITPEHLGELSIRVATHGSNVSLQILTSDSKAKKLIEESLDSLKETLAQKSLMVTQLDISSQPFDPPSEQISRQSQDSSSQGGFSQNSSFFNQGEFQENRSQNSRDRFYPQSPSWKSGRMLSAAPEGRIRRSESSRIDVRA